MVCSDHVLRHATTSTNCCGANQHAPTFTPTGPQQALAPGSSRSAAAAMKLLYKPGLHSCNPVADTAGCCCQLDQMPELHGCHAIGHCFPKCRSLATGCLLPLLLPRLLLQASSSAGRNCRGTVSRGMPVLLLLLLLCCLLLALLVAVQLPWLQHQPALAAHARRSESHLLANQSPQLVQVDNGAVVVVLLLVEVPHTNLQRSRTQANSHS